LLTEEELKENILTDDTGSTLQHIKDTFKRDIKDFETTGEISQHLHDALYDYYQDDMPYGVQKARDGDPYEWVADRFGADLGLPGYGMNSPGVPDEDSGLERESVMHGDYAEENSRMRKLAGMQDEGKEDSAGHIIKKLLDPIAQGLAGGSGGKSLSTPLVGEEETDEGVLGTVGGALAGGGLGAMLGGALGGPAGAIAGQGVGAAVGGVGGQELTKGGSGIIEDDKEEDDSSVLPAVAAGLLGAGLGYAAGSYVPSGSVEVDMVSPNIGNGSSAPLKGADSILEKDEEETDEGWKGRLAGGLAGGSIGGALGAAGGPIGSIAGQIAGGIAGGQIGDKIGDKIDDKIDALEETNEDDASLFDDATCNMTEAGENCSVHGMKECWGSDTSPLAGKYGHSGKMKEVGKDTSFLDRLKELSGMRK
jgi:hypothetical protein